MFLNLAKFTGKHLCQGLFFNKVAGELHEATKIKFVGVAVLQSLWLSNASKYFEISSLVEVGIFSKISLIKTVLYVTKLLQQTDLSSELNEIFRNWFSVDFKENRKADHYCDCS